MDFDVATGASIEATCTGAIRGVWVGEVQRQIELTVFILRINNVFTFGRFVVSLPFLCTDWLASQRNSVCLQDAPIALKRHCPRRFHDHNSIRYLLLAYLRPCCSRRDQQRKCRQCDCSVEGAHLGTHDPSDGYPLLAQIIRRPIAPDKRARRRTACGSASRLLVQKSQNRTSKFARPSY
jgi:hypothetical protein